MSRDLSPIARNALFAQESGEAFIALVKLEHPNLTGPICVTSAGIDVDSRGETYLAFPFDVALPDEAPDRPPRSKLRIDNVDQEMGITVREINTAPTITIDVVTASDLDTPEVTYPDFRLNNVTIDRLYIEGDLTLEEFTSEPYGGTFTKSLYPGLY